MAENKAKLHLPGHDKPIELPMLKGTMNDEFIDIAELGKFGIYTLDPGYATTGSCESQITYIDGNKGILLHRGYPIEQLAEQSDFLEVCYLIFKGELPTTKQKQQFVHEITHHTMLHEQLVKFFQGFRRDAHPMAIMVGVVGALSSFYHEQFDPAKPSDRIEVAYRLIAKIATIAAMSYKYYIGQPFMHPRNDLDYASNFLHMMFGNPCEPSHINPIISKALDKIFILHADHEQNASTATVRIAGSTGANPFACISAGIGALWGPAHGGANEAALTMLKDIGNVKNIPQFIKRAKDKNDPFRLMGFGHRVYKNYDPRAKIMRDTCHAVLKEVGRNDEPTLEIALRLEEIALKDEYFIEKKLYPNVDFYSGITLNAMGIPTNMFTVIFALARTTGWISHWNEMVEHKLRMGRPRQRYTGHSKHDFVPIEKRK